MLTTKKFAALFAALALAGATAPIASADPPKQKCNSGNGNGSEVAGADCDPGNSGGHNNGGDN